MAGFVTIAAIAIVGIVGTVGWIVCVSLGIRRADRHSLSITAAHHNRAPVSRLARHSTGLHRV